MKRRIAKSSPDDGYEAIEWFVFTSAFIVRKLNDSERLSYEAAARTTPAQVYPAISPTAEDPLDDDDLGDRYDFERAKTKRLSLEAMCNQIIHSYDFAVARSGL